MRMLEHAIEVMIVKKKGEPLILDFWLDNEEYLELTKKKDLFSGISNTKALLERICLGFEHPFDGTMDIDDFLDEFDHMDTYASFKRTAKRIAFNAVEAVVLMSTINQEYGVHNYKYEWIMYTLSSGHVTTGSGFGDNPWDPINQLNLLEPGDGEELSEILVDESPKPRKAVPFDLEQFNRDLKHKGEQWLLKYGDVIEKDPVITWTGKTFVLSGTEALGDDFEINIEKAIISRGGVVRSSVSGKTDFLIVDPQWSGEYKVKKAIEQQAKGKPVKVILGTDFIASLQTSMNCMQDLEKEYSEPVSGSYGFISDNKKKAGYRDIKVDHEDLQTTNDKYEKNAVQKKKVADPRQLLPSECQISADGVFTSYWGPKSEIILPDTVRRIGRCYFADTVTSVVIPDTVTVIDEFAFSGMEQLKSISLPKGLTVIKQFAFNGCSGMTSIVVPKSVTSVGYAAFSDCTNLSSITIPDSVTEIGESAFANCRSLTEMTLPDSVISIGNWAFSGCTCLQTITISDRATDISDTTFYECDSLTKVIISPGSQVVPGWIRDFKESLEKVEISAGVTEIQNDAFYECANMKKVTIPHTVTAIGNSAFEGCYRLSDISIPDSVISIGERAFKGCSNLTHIVIPESVISIGYNAFSECEKLKTVTLSDRVTDNGCSFFEDCGSVSKVIILPGSQTVPSWIPAGANLREVIIPEGITHIAQDAFCNCSGLEEITLPDSLLSIADASFMGCSGLREIRIPNQVMEIGESAFQECSGLVSITIPDSVKSIGDYAFGNCAELRMVTIPSGVTKIGNGVFEGCTKLKNAVLPDTLTSIGERAFHKCGELIDITIPDSVASIEKRAFHGCVSLKNIKIPSNITQMGYLSFFGCTNLEYAVVSRGSCAEQYFEEEGIEYRFAGEDTISRKPSKNRRTEIFEVSWNGTFRGYWGSETSIVLPNSVKTIGSYCELSDTVQSIIIPKGVTSIDEGAFFRCPRLVSIVIPDSVVSIGKQAFSECTGLTNITIPESVTSIGAQVFFECNNLTSISLPESVTSIGDKAFYHCNSLTNIRIPNSVTSIGNYAFSRCTGLIDIVIPENVTFIGNHAFSECTGATSVIIPGSLATVNNGAFEECTRLERVTISKNVTTIENFAFSGVSGLKEIIIPNSVTSIGDCSFLDCNNMTIIAPKDSFAKKFAKNRNIPFRVDDTVEKRKVAEEAQKEVEAKFLALQVARAAAERSQNAAAKVEHPQEKEVERSKHAATKVEHLRQKEVKRSLNTAEDSERKRQEELNRRRARYKEISDAIALQQQIISQNKSWFGVQAKIRKAAQKELASLQAQLAEEFFNEQS